MDHNTSKTDRELFVEMLKKIGKIGKIPDQNNDQNLKSFEYSETRHAITIGCGMGDNDALTEFFFDEAGNMTDHAAWSDGFCKE